MFSLSWLLVFSQVTVCSHRATSSTTQASSCPHRTATPTQEVLLAATQAILVHTGHCPHAAHTGVFSVGPHRLILIHTGQLLHTGVFSVVPHRLILVHTGQLLHTGVFSVCHTGLFSSTQDSCSTRRLPHRLLVTSRSSHRAARLYRCHQMLEP